jgi:catechol 2,3-dioxygenase-like lactoylglutathione lyase family enzyme
LDVIKPTLHHVTFKTTRLQEMVDWYRAVIGVEVQFQDANNAWTTNDGANHRIAFLAVPGLSDDPDKVSHNGMHHSAFEYASFSDLMASYERLKAQSILPAISVEHGLTTSLYYKDPEGNFVELQSDNFGDWAKSSAWMRTSPGFAKNPIGVFFDPDKVSRAFSEGQSFAELRAAIRAGEFAPQPVTDTGLPPLELTTSDTI